MSSLRSSSDSLAALGEAGLLRVLTGKWKPNRARVITGAGDDCAVLRGEGKNHFLVFKTDAVSEDVHFTPQAPPGWIGHKALARALSDLAAMGAIPLAAVITLGVPANESVRRLRAIYRGLERTAKRYGVDLVGGETIRARQLFLNVALLGECRGYRPVLRSGARPGDSIFVTGKLGGAQVRHHLTFKPRLVEGKWLARNGLASAMMDLSDGLGADLPRLMAASGFEAQLDLAAIPRRPGATVKAAFEDGEDYELLFTTRPFHVKTLKKGWPFGVSLRCIGIISHCRVKSEHFAFAHGFDHFKQR
ncbi:MAG TPA: thiamine-phosphate kinase [Candidatus Methylacidiphilales bacterium]|nr:thiamine-phosphate kinase [Candidatus Methylacidiphilales bacterium]